MEPVWKAPAVDWTDVEQGSGEVKVTTLHYRASLTDGSYTASTYGTTPDDGSRVYTKPALESVPESVVIGWIKQALGAEAVTEIEAQLAVNLEQLKNPTSGTVNPGA